MKVCSKCNENKDLSEFSLSKVNKDGLRGQCKTCRSEYSSVYRKCHKETVNAGNRQYRTDYPEQTNAYSDKWRKKYPEKSAARTSRRHAAKLQRTPKWLTTSDYIEIDWAYRLAAIRTKETGVKYEIDHILPLRGELISGLHVPSNLQLLPKKENARKGNRL